MLIIRPNGRITFIPDWRQNADAVRGRARRLLVSGTMARLRARAGRRSVHDPHVAAVDEFVELAGAVFGDGGLDLVDEEVFVGLALHVAEDADGLGVLGELHAGEHEGDRGVLLGGVVDEAVVFGEAGLRV